MRFLGSAQANLNWNLDLFGGQKAAIEGARASARAAALDVAAARLAIAGSVVQTYIDLARAEAQATLARRTIATRERSVQLVDVRIRNRLASNLQATAAQTYCRRRASRWRRRTAPAPCVNALAALAGRGPDYAAAIRPATLRLDTALPLPARVPADLIARRPTSPPRRHGSRPPPPAARSRAALSIPTSTSPRSPASRRSASATSSASMPARRAPDRRSICRSSTTAG